MSLLIAFVLLIIGGILKGLSATGLVPSNILTEQGIYFASAAQLTLLSFPFLPLGPILMCGYKTLFSL